MEAFLAGQKKIPLSWYYSETNYLWSVRVSIGDGTRRQIEMKLQDHETSLINMQTN